MRFRLRRLLATQTSLAHYIYVCHGVKAAPPGSGSGLDFLVERDRYIRYLETRAAPFVSLDDALAGGGDALTIDDATRAGLDAALLALERGHAVTLFVNPPVMESGKAYPHWVLRWAVAVGSGVLDHPAVGRVALDDGAAALTAVREWVLRAENDGQVAERVDDLLDRMPHRPDPEDLPREALPPSMGELQAAVARGLAVGNHGWDHVELSPLDPLEARRMVDQARAWIAENLVLTTEAVAVPFGHDIPVLPRDGTGPSAWLLHNHSLMPGMIWPGVFNRAALSVG